MTFLRKICILLLFMVAVNAFIAGYLFMNDPSGSALGTNVDLLKHSPFHSFFTPGLILFTVNGILCTFTGLTLSFKKNYSFLLLIAQGVLLGGWILIQALMLREFNLLHLVFTLLSLFFTWAGIYLQRNTGK